MLRCSVVGLYYWSRYRLPTPMPKFDGPAPIAAPQNMNNTKTNEFIDPIDDKFPISIRGPLVRPDVPEEQYVDSWYVCTSMTHNMGEYKPWSASAPAHSFRFRPFPEFDAKGREYVGQMRAMARYDPRRTRGKGSAGFPFREAYLTRMASGAGRGEGRDFDACAAFGRHRRTPRPPNTAHTSTSSRADRGRTSPRCEEDDDVGDEETAAPSLETTMDRAIAERFHGRRVLSPLQVQRDVGRIEPPLPCAGKPYPRLTATATATAPEKGPPPRRDFPFRWNTDDWYEYEVAKVRNRRFVFANTEESGPAGSEVTYRIVLDAAWDHHAARLAEDVCAFVRDVGRAVVSEKLRSVRAMLHALALAHESPRKDGVARVGGRPVDDPRRAAPVSPELRAAFAAAARGPFGGRDDYEAEEVSRFVRADLTRLEEQCVGVLNRCNVPIPAATTLTSAQLSWPVVERLEPWVRLAEFWTSASDTSFTELEMSTAHYEFRRHFRVVLIKLPFQSSELEQRLLALRHWLHRGTRCEFHTTYRRNVVHDGALFRTEHDPATPVSHRHHRLFSFALDWQQTPVNYLAEERVRAGDSWASVARRLGCSAEELRRENGAVEEADEEGRDGGDGGESEATNQPPPGTTRATHRPMAEALVAGSTVMVPRAATRRLTSFGATPRVLSLCGADGTDAVPRRIRTWREAAQRLHCTVEELQEANGYAALSYRRPPRPTGATDTPDHRQTIGADTGGGEAEGGEDDHGDEEGEFDASVTELVVPHSVWCATAEEEFSSSEEVYASDTWATLAERLGCTVSDLRLANPELVAAAAAANAPARAMTPDEGGVCGDGEAGMMMMHSEDVDRIAFIDHVRGRAACAGEHDRATSMGAATAEEQESRALRAAGHVRVPATARTPRRLTNPQLRPPGATDALFPRTAGEQRMGKLESIPAAPPNAADFPHEYHTPTSRFPATPPFSLGSDDWMTYTANYLDHQFAHRNEPTPVYNVNKLWPMQQVPGRVDQTPFEEDQTWLMHPIPVQQMEQHHPEKDLQDLPFVNHEQFPRSIEWTAP